MPNFMKTVGHDSATWAGSSIQVTVGGATATWNFNSEIGGTSATGYEVIDNFVTWANAGARAWSGTVAFYWAIVEFDATGRTSLKVTSSGATPAFVVSSGLQTLMNLPGSASTTLTPTAGARSSFNVTLSVEHFSKRSLGSGGSTSAGSFFTGAQAYARRRPKVSAICTEAEAFALSESLAVSSNPRQLHSYATTLGGWLLVDCGAVKLSRKGRTFYSAAFEVSQ